MHARPDPQGAATEHVPPGAPGATRATHPDFRGQARLVTLRPTVTHAGGATLTAL